MKPLPVFLKQPKNLVVLSAAAVLTGYVVFLIMANYTSQTDLRRSSVERFLEDEQNLARMIGGFFFERKAGMADLAGSRAIAIYFENKALGMTMTYGLKAGMIGIRKRLETFMGERRLGNDPIYRRILFVDMDGKIIAAAGEAAEVTSEQNRSDLLKSCAEEPCIRVIAEGAQQDVVMIAPSRFKGALVGVVAAWMDMETIRRHFLAPADPSVHRRLVLNHEKSAAGILSGLHPDVNILSTESGGMDKPIQASGKPETVTCSAPVEGTPFALQSTAPASRVYGETHPRRLLLATAALGILILGTTIYFVSMNTRNRVLQARLEEAAGREAEIQDKNLALEDYRRNLEQMVEERTLQLKEVQKELLQKATEAGRAQMATVVLHNIGNAVTPAMVHVEQMKTDGLEKISFYLNRCFKDLKAHAADLGGYVTRDPRGKEVLTYTETLLLELEKYKTHRLEVVEKIASALSYVAEILTLEQSYGPAAARMNETVDLNRLMEDALLMQAESIRQRNIHVTKALAAGPVSLKIDKIRLMQTLVNLIRNSCEAMDLMDAPADGRRIDVKTFQENGGTGFEIVDTGIGLETGEAEGLFEFGKSKKGSSGFGLTYCREFVEAHKGSIVLTSPGPGKGTTVRVAFPPSA